MRKKILLIMFLLLLLVNSILMPGNAAEFSIYLSERAQINSPEVLLGDVADISAPDEIFQEIAAINLETINDLEREIEISRRLVELHVRNADYNYDDFVVEGAERVRVEVETRTLTPEALFADVEEKIEEHFHSRDGNNFPETEIRIEMLEEPDEILIPAGRTEVKLPRNNFFSGGRISQPVEIHADGERWHRLYLTLSIKHELKAYKLTEDVARGQRLTDSAVEKKPLKVEHLPEELVIDLDEKLVREGVFRRNYNAGELLSLNMLELPVIINHGDEVTARIQVGNVKIHVDMIARDRGKSGEHITLENKNTGERVEGKVLNENMVEIID